MRSRSLIAVALAFGVAGAAPPPADVPGRGPLFGGPQFHVNPLDFAMQAFAASALPTRAHGTPAVLYAGEHERVQAWRLEGVMTGRQTRVAAGTASAVLEGFHANPLSALATLQAGDALQCWTLRDTDRFQPIPEGWFGSVQDGEPILEGALETEVYARVLTMANYTSNRALVANSRSDVTTTHLLTDAAFYRGQVIHFEGHVHLVNRYRPPPEAADEGVNDLYEAWLFPDTMGAQAVCVVFTEWPAALPRTLLGAGKLKEGVRVRAAGYFFKQFGYGTRDKTQPMKKAPLLIAHTITVPGPKAKPDVFTAAWVKPILYVVPAMFVALIFGAIGLTYYFRRQDQQLRDRLRRARDAEFVAPRRTPCRSPPRSPPSRSPGRICPACSAATPPRAGTAGWAAPRPLKVPRSRAANRPTTRQVRSRGRWRGEPRRRPRHADRR
ncbi:MAG: hypothetical protein ACRC33_27685 [Gemmataceae bacterium]